MANFLTESYTNTKDFIAEVREEMRKVTWPSLDEVQGATIVVIVTTFIFGFYLGLCDLIFTRGLPSSPLNTLGWSIIALIALFVISYTIFYTSRG